MGKLKVTVIDGQNLPVKDMNGKSDPYVLLTYKKQEHKTTTKKETINPVWHESFEFTIDDFSEILHIDVWDKDTITKDDFMGRTEISFGMLKLEANKSVVISRSLVGEQRKGSVNWKDMLGNDKDSRFGTLRLELLSDFTN